MYEAFISGTGVYTPAHSVSNDELVSSFNTYVDNFNQEHAAAISAGEITALEHSSVEFIEKASGIKSRFVMNKDGVIDPAVMHPILPERGDEENSILCEIGVAAAEVALKNANKTAADIDQVIVACSNLQRAYPAISIEIQSAMGIEGFGYDMNVACSSATFGLQAAINSVQTGSARSVLLISPEICTAHLNFRDRDSHFIFGDVASAIVIERADAVTSENSFKAVDIRLKTVFSNNIRNNFGFLNRCAPGSEHDPDKLFRQNGRKVFKEVCPMVADMISEQLEKNQIPTEKLKRMWLHQANVNMNQFIARRVLGKEPDEMIAPTILNEYANTSSAGSIIAFHKHQDDFQSGDIGVICSFGAGYSAGSVLLQKM